MNHVCLCCLQLQHVLKDKGVLALIKKKVAEQEGRKPDQRWDMKEIVTYVSLLLDPPIFMYACGHVIIHMHHNHNFDL